MSICFNKVVRLVRAEVVRGAADRQPIAARSSLSKALVEAYTCIPGIRILPPLQAIQGVPWPNSPHLILRACFAKTKICSRCCTKIFS